MAEPARAGVTLERLGKRFGNVEAVHEVSLEIAEGEFFCLLGPSGCGKTTTLRLIAGFEEPTTGRVLLAGRDVTRVPAHRRPVNTVFQSYALFPHLSVADNVAFGLRFQRTTKEERTRRVGEALGLVRLEGLERRRPAQLSGGQQQRVALARALVLNPRVLLLDEPLGALDAKLRRALQLELKAIQEEIGITFVYVTHDQEEALTMSDRMAVMLDGRIQQVGAPREVYEQPETTFIADFLGISNLMTAQAEGDGRVRLDEIELQVDAGDTNARGEVRLTIRPERVRLEPPGSPGTNRLAGRVERAVYVGPTTQVIIALPSGHQLQAVMTSSDARASLAEDEEVTVYLPPDALRVLKASADGGEPADPSPSSLPPPRDA